MPTKSNNTGGRGGARPGAGRKKSAVKEKAENGNRADADWKCWIFPKSRVSICQSPMSFLSAEQRDGVRSRRKKSTRKPGRVKEGGLRGEGVSQLLERYAMCSARWIQCEEMTNRMGFLSKHPTTQKPIPSPSSTSALIT